MNAEVSTALAAAPPVVPPVAAAAAPRSVWDRYQPWRRTVEIATWVTIFAVNAAAGTLTAIIDIHRYGLAIPDWAPLVWETSSCATALALVPALVWFTRAVPLRFDRWRRALALHLLALSLIHI